MGNESSKFEIEKLRIAHEVRIEEAQINKEVFTTNSSLQNIIF